jgi:hypothetical protein
VLRFPACSASPLHLFAISLVLSRYITASTQQVTYYNKPSLIEMSLQVVNILGSLLHRTDLCRALQRSVRLLLPTARPWGHSLWGTVSVTERSGWRKSIYFFALWWPLSEVKYSEQAPEGAHVPMLEQWCTISSLITKNLRKSKSSDGCMEHSLHWEASRTWENYENHRIYNWTQTCIT